MTPNQKEMNVFKKIWTFGRILTIYNKNVE